MPERNPLEKVRPERYPRAFSKNVVLGDWLPRQVPVHPARFVVGMESDERPLFPPHGQVQGTAIQCASYVGRVEEVSERGEVTITLWERPNGREGLTTLSVDKHLAGNKPSAGDLLWIWTWIDVTERRRKKRIHVKVEEPELTGDDLQQLRDVLVRLRSGKE